MKARDVVGKRIVAVRHARNRKEGGRAPFVYVEALVLDDGSEMRTHAYESDYEPLGTLLYVPAKAGGKVSAGKVAAAREPRFWAVKRKTENDPDYLARSYMQAVGNQERVAYEHGCAVGDVEIIPLYEKKE